jgi:hypothetical protein
MAAVSPCGPTALPTARHRELVLQVKPPGRNHESRGIALPTTWLPRRSTTALTSPGCETSARHVLAEHATPPTEVTAPGRATRVHDDPAL